jgi:hypothetical protein
MADNQIAKLLSSYKFQRHLLLLYFYFPFTFLFSSFFLYFSLPYVSLNEISFIHLFVFLSFLFFSFLFFSFLFFPFVHLSSPTSFVTSFPCFPLLSNCYFLSLYSFISSVTSPSACVCFSRSLWLFNYSSLHIRLAPLIRLQFERPHW